MMDDNSWTGLMIICLVVIVIIVICCSPASAAECRLVGKPEPEEWEPDPEDVAYISRTIWGECRGCPEEEQIATAWSILQRMDSPDFPDTVAGVVLQPNQWQGYGHNNPEAPFHDMARAALIQHHNGEHGPLPDGFFWCSGDGNHQTFRNTWVRTEETRYYP